MKKFFKRFWFDLWLLIFASTTFLFGEVDQKNYYILLGLFFISNFLNLLRENVAKDTTELDDEFKAFAERSIENLIAEINYPQMSEGEKKHLFGVWENYKKTANETRKSKSWSLKSVKNAKERAWPNS